MAYRRILPLLLFSLLARASAAAELGEPRVTSYRGQALVADIELSGLDDPAAAVQVRVANPDVYRGASITMPPILSALSLTVVRQGGKQVVHVTSNRPVDTELLHLFLELGQGSNRNVRLASLWLAPDSRPAPPPVALPVTQVTAPSAPAVPTAAPAFKPEYRPAPQPAALPVAPLALAPLHLAPVNTALPDALHAASPASCKAASSGNTCAVLDTKNVALQAKLAGLEDKIRLLEATLAPVKTVQAAPAVAASAPAVAVMVKPKKHKPVTPPPTATPWLWIALAAVIGLAALGAIVFLLLRRRRTRKTPEVAAPAKPPGVMAGIRQRLMPAAAEPADS